MQWHTLTAEEAGEEGEAVQKGQREQGLTGDQSGNGVSVIFLGILFYFY